MTMKRNKKKLRLNWMKLGTNTKNYMTRSKTRRASIRILCIYWVNSLITLSVKILNSLMVIKTMERTLRLIFIWIWILSRVLRTSKRISTIKVCWPYAWFYLSKFNHTSLTSKSKKTFSKSQWNFKTWHKLWLRARWTSFIMHLLM